MLGMVVLARGTALVGLHGGERWASMVGSVGGGLVWKGEVVGKYSREGGDGGGLKLPWGCCSGLRWAERRVEDERKLEYLRASVSSFSMAILVSCPCAGIAPVPGLDF